MKLFVDANVIIAVLNKEYPLFSNAARVLSLHNKNGFCVFTSPLCLAIAFYFSSKKSGEKVAKRKIELLSQNIGLTTIDELVTQKALNNKQIHDFEDGMEYYSAIEKFCWAIITEDQEDFYFSDIDVFSCEDFLSMLSETKK